MLLLLEHENNSIEYCNKDITIKFEWCNIFVALGFKTQLQLTGHYN